jgi:hypothetical protein
MSVPGKEAPKTAMGPRAVPVKDSRVSTAARVRPIDPSGLEVQAVGIVPQPRKLDRALNNAKKTPRKF